MLFVFVLCEDDAERVDLGYREQSKKFQRLVDNAQPFIAMLPWPRDFEKDHFLRPGEKLLFNSI